MSNLSPLAPDLANGPYPRSPRTFLGDYVVAARTLDKCRAVLAGTNGEYHFDCPLDNFFLGFVGITADDFKDNLRASAKSADKKSNPRMDANNRRRVFGSKNNPVHPLHPCSISTSQNPCSSVSLFSRPFTVKKNLSAPSPSPKLPATS